MGASAIPESVDFMAFAVNVKTIAPKKKLYQSGHAIWWYDMPMAVYSFLEEYDFIGKKVIPFATSAGSGFSDTIDTIEKLIPEAEVVRNGLHIPMDDVEKAQPQIEEWLK